MRSSGVISVHARVHVCMCACMLCIVWREHEMPLRCNYVLSVSALRGRKSRKTPPVRCGTGTQSCSCVDAPSHPDKQHEWDDGATIERDISKQSQPSIIPISRSGQNGGNWSGTMQPTTAVAEGTQSIGGLIYMPLVPRPACACELIPAHVRPACICVAYRQKPACVCVCVDATVM